MSAAIEGLPVERLVGRMRTLQEDHAPDGWPAVLMRDITALCDALERLTPKFAIGESVGVDDFSGTYHGIVVSRSEHKSIRPQYAVFADYNGKKEARWFKEDQLYKPNAKLQPPQAPGERPDETN